ncbi:SDR family oxidoreductase [Alloyangia pacifica]|uniref:NAD(P)H dehydrogenase (Quinone) n=1 Tax=Alloyangia pacifica TaxID=311180 RepID=A0A1I6PFL4_9RHOB|nr:SDR family oxidoreductase [Alloyangia pacifica]SDG26509.1 NAD(P)H dehydrogenase (quinone) [Alloyangia pacifica]SFS38943.1 NAD(P)H dehydrogenase (quinone) [Alloyangia pacifica]
MSDTLDYMITGATGQLGALVLEQLKAAAPDATIGALVRRPDAASALEAQGFTVRMASYDDPAALEAALAGVAKLLLISSSEVGKRAVQHRNVIAAAEKAGVNFVAYTSILNADSSPLTVLPGEHVATEQALEASGLDYALLRNGWYSENYVMGAGAALEHGALIGAAGEGRISSAARADYAAAAVAVLTGETPARGTVYELAGDQSYTLTEFAAALSEIAGKQIPYVNMSEPDYAAALEGAGLPTPVAQMLADSDNGAAQGGLFSDDKTLSGLIGRPTTPWKETLAAGVAVEA